MSLQLPMAATIFIVFGIGALCGVLNGFFSIKMRLAPFILTLATGQIFRGIAYIVTDGIAIGGMNDTVKSLGQAMIFGFIPITLYS
jgi:ribose transport system permease protein